MVQKVSSEWSKYVHVKNICAFLSPFSEPVWCKMCGLENDGQGQEYNIRNGVFRWQISHHLYIKVILYIFALALTVSEI